MKCEGEEEENVLKLEMNELASQPTHVMTLLNSRKEIPTKKKKKMYKHLPSAASSIHCL